MKECIEKSKILRENYNNSKGINKKQIGQPVTTALLLKLIAS